MEKRKAPEAQKERLLNCKQCHQILAQLYDNFLQQTDERENKQPPRLTRSWHLRPLTTNLKELNLTGKSAKISQPQDP